MIEIKHRYTGAVLFCYTPDGTIKDAVEAAVKVGASLDYARLDYARLDYARLDYASLDGARLDGASLVGASLDGARLVGARLDGASLDYASLDGARLDGASLDGASLVGASLDGARLDGARLDGASLDGASLVGAKNAELAIARTRILPEGGIIGWKKCQNGVIVKLAIPAEAKRSHAFWRKCRAEFAYVLEVIGADVGVSIFDENTKYVKDALVQCYEWDDDFTKECAGGIHFYITKEEAEAHT